MSATSWLARTAENLGIECSVLLSWSRPGVCAFEFLPALVCRLDGRGKFHGIAERGSETPGKKRICKPARLTIDDHCRQAACTESHDRFAASHCLNHGIGKIVLQ